VDAEEPGTRSTLAGQIVAAAKRSPRTAGTAAGVAAVLVVGTLLRYGGGANAVLWALVQVLLVFIAWFDIQERRILNVVVAPAAAVAVLCRAGFDRGGLVECAVAGAAAFATFLVLAIIARGGLGMGDVKFAALLGLLLGRQAFAALLGGVVVGGLAAAAILLMRHGSRRTTYAYGPYLALGGAMAVLLTQPPHLA